jgi:hypothetical protein
VCYTRGMKQVHHRREDFGGGRDWRHTMHRPPSRLMLVAAVAMIVVSMALVMAIAVMLAYGW